MSELGQDSGYCRYEEAGSYLATIKDPRLKAFMAFGLTTVLMRRDLAGVAPTSPFDLLFFVQALRAMFAEEVAIKLIIEGRQEEMRWWDDDEKSDPSGLR